MASVLYSEIFSSFLGRISDYELAELDEADAVERLTEYLHKSVADPFIHKLFSSVVLNDEAETLDFVMKITVSDEEDVEFVINVLSERMVVAWLSPSVMSKINIAQYFGGKESNFFSQANHLEQLRGILKDAKLTVRKMIRDRDYSDPSRLEG